MERTWKEIAVGATNVASFDDGRLEGVRALAGQRRDVVRGLSRRQIDELRRAVPEIFWPTPSQLDPMEAAPAFGIPALASA